MKNKNNLSTIFSLLLVILSLVLAIGVKKIFPACPLPAAMPMQMDKSDNRMASSSNKMSSNSISGTDKMSSGSMSKTDKMSSSSMSNMEDKNSEKGCVMPKKPMIMRCHWAEQAVFATGIALAVMALLLFIFKAPRERAAISASMIPVTVMAMLFPQVIIKLCMMSTMRCWTSMRPAVIGVTAVLLVIEIANIIINVKKK